MLNSLQRRMDTKWTTEELALGLGRGSVDEGLALEAP